MAMNGWGDDFETAHGPDGDEEIAARRAEADDAAEWYELWLAACENAGGPVPDAAADWSPEQGAAEGEDGDVIGGRVLVAYDGEIPF